MNGTTSAGFTVWFTGMSGAGKSIDLLNDANISAPH